MSANDDVEYGGEYGSFRTTAPPERPPVSSLTAEALREMMGPAPERRPSLGRQLEASATRTHARAMPKPTGSRARPQTSALVKPVPHPRPPRPTSAVDMPPTSSEGRLGVGGINRGLSAPDALQSPAGSAWRSLSPKCTSFSHEPSSHCVPSTPGGCTTTAAASSRPNSGASVLNTSADAAVLLADSFLLAPAVAAPAEPPSPAPAVEEDITEVASSPPAAPVNRQSPAAASRAAAVASIAATYGAGMPQARRILADALAFALGDGASAFAAANKEPLALELPSFAASPPHPILLPSAAARASAAYAHEKAHHSEMQARQEVEGLLHEEATWRRSLHAEAVGGMLTLLARGEGLARRCLRYEEAAAFFGLEESRLAHRAAMLASREADARTGVHTAHHASLCQLVTQFLEPLAREALVAEEFAGRAALGQAAGSAVVSAFAGAVDAARGWYYSVAECADYKHTQEAQATADLLGGAVPLALCALLDSDDITFIHDCVVDTQRVQQQVAVAAANPESGEAVVETTPAALPALTVPPHREVEDASPLEGQQVSPAEHNPACISATDTAQAHEEHMVGAQSAEVTAIECSVQTDDDGFTAPPAEQRALSPCMSTARPATADCASQTPRLKTRRRPHTPRDGSGRRRATAAAGVATQTPHVPRPLSARAPGDANRWAAYMTGNEYDAKSTSLRLGGGTGPAGGARARPSSASWAGPGPSTGHPQPQYQPQPPHPHQARSHHTGAWAGSASHDEGMDAAEVDRIVSALFRCRRDVRLAVHAAEEHARFTLADIEATTRDMIRQAQYTHRMPDV